MTKLLGFSLILTAALVCSEIYVSDEDRCAMQMLSELLGFALARGVIAHSDLYGTEPAVIDALLKDGETAARWNTYRAYRSIRRADTPPPQGEWRRIYAKKRYIDPMAIGFGRVRTNDPVLRKAIDAFLKQPQDYWVCAVPDRGPLE